MSAPAARKPCPGGCGRMIVASWRQCKVRTCADEAAYRHRAEHGDDLGLNAIIDENRRRRGDAEQRLWAEIRHQRLWYSSMKEETRAIQRITRLRVAELQAFGQRMLKVGKLRAGGGVSHLTDSEVFELSELIDAQERDARKTLIQDAGGGQVSFDARADGLRDQFRGVEWLDPTYEAFEREERLHREHLEWELDLLNRGHGYRARGPVMREWEVMEHDRQALERAGGGGTRGKKSSSGHNSGTRRTNPNAGPSQRTTRVAKAKK